MNSNIVNISTIETISKIANSKDFVIVTSGGWKSILPTKDAIVGSKIIIFQYNSFIPAEDNRLDLFRRSFFTYKNIRGFRVKNYYHSGNYFNSIFLSIKYFPELNDLPIGHNLTSFFNAILFEDELISLDIGVFSENFIVPNYFIEDLNLFNCSSHFDSQISSRTFYKELNHIGINFIFSFTSEGLIIAHNERIISNSFPSVFHKQLELQNVNLESFMPFKNLIFDSVLVPIDTSTPYINSKPYKVIIKNIYDKEIQRQLYIHEKDLLLSEILSKGAFIDFSPFNGFYTTPKDSSYREIVTSLKESTKLFPSFNSVSYKRIDGKFSFYIPNII